jgi:hypothetical protein
MAASFLKAEFGYACNLANKQRTGNRIVGQFENISRRLHSERGEFRVFQKCCAHCLCEKLN